MYLRPNGLKNGKMPYIQEDKKMKKKLICALLAGCMAISPATMSFAAETELATDAASEAVTEAASEAASEAVTEATSEAASETGKKTEYPLTISNFNYEKEPVEETFEKAPEQFP